MKLCRQPRSVFLQWKPGKCISADGCADTSLHVHSLTRHVGCEMVGGRSLCQLQRCSVNQNPCLHARNVFVMGVAAFKLTLVSVDSARVDPWCRPHGVGGCSSSPLCSVLPCYATAWNCPAQPKSLLCVETFWVSAVQWAKQNQVTSSSFLRLCATSEGYRFSFDVM